MTKDGRTGVNITYNDLNLPSRIVGNSGSVEYIYDATGTKLAQKAGGSLTYYRGPMVYQGNALELIFQPEGTITWANGMYTYNYFKTDHTGSTRKLLSVGPGMSGGQQFYSMQSTDHYPFGLAHNYNNLDRLINVYDYEKIQSYILFAWDHDVPVVCMSR
ncbi:MAG: hypothetical protein IJC16_03955 [Rikenellaceae bacterium]|nr:hypothetical protein [Rikenellaceae bacterium]